MGNANGRMATERWKPGITFTCMHVLGHYGLGAWTPDGCLACYCSGHSTTCHSAADWHEATVLSQWNLVDGLTDVDQRWTAVDQHGRNISLDNPTLVDDQLSS